MLTWSQGRIKTNVKFSKQSMELICNSTGLNEGLKPENIYSRSRDANLKRGNSEGCKAYASSQPA